METPKYLQIKNLIHEEIQHMASNEVIESERVLTKRLNASRMTVRRALDELVEEGFLYREKNKGTFVSDKSLNKKNTLVSDTENNNSEFHIINFDVKYSVKEDIMKKLNVGFDKTSSIIRAIRVVSRNNKPEKIEEFYIVRSFIDEKNLNKFDKLLDLNLYLKNSTMTQKLMPTTVPAKYASILKVAIDEPIITIEGILRNNSGIPYIYYRSYNHPRNEIIEITF